VLQDAGLVYSRNRHLFTDNIIGVDNKDKMNVQFCEYGDKIEVKFHC
jgi:hypothetical protein